MRYEFIMCQMDLTFMPFYFSIHYIRMLCVVSLMCAYVVHASVWFYPDASSLRAAHLF